MLKKGDRFIVIKYGVLNGFRGCIDSHKQVIDELGYCWFGKIGTSPSIQSINSKLSGKSRYLILYSQGKANLCEFTDIMAEKPDKGYPDYYNDLIYGRGVKPSLYLKLVSIRDISLEELKGFATLSSGRNLIQTITRSMNSFFYGIYPEKELNFNDPIKEPHKKKKESKPKKNILYDKSSCKYRLDGICSCKSCINYLYECDRPNSCLKQKPLPLKGE